MTTPEDDLPECCGSGCSNCVLDRKTIIYQNASGAKANILDSTYRRFRCIGIGKCTSNTFHFRFRHEEDATAEKQLIIPPGSHLMLRAPKDYRDSQQQRSPANQLFEQWRSEESTAAVKQDGARRPRDAQRIPKYDQSERDLYFSRPYTPIRVDREGRSFEVLVKLEVGGEMSEYFTQMAEGDITEWKGIYGGFQWERNSRKRLVAFVQGVGLAPVYAIMASILEDEEDETRLTLCYCCKDVDSVLLRSEIHSYARFWNFENYIYLSQESCSCGKKSNRSCTCLSSRKKYGERIFNHRLEQVDVENLLKKPVQESVQVLVCGNDSFTRFVESCLTNLNISDYYKF